MKDSKTRNNFAEMWCLNADLFKDTEDKLDLNPETLKILTETLDDMHLIISELIKYQNSLQEQLQSYNNLYELLKNKRIN